MIAVHDALNPVILVLDICSSEKICRGLVLELTSEGV